MGSPDLLYDIVFMYNSTIIYITIYSHVIFKTEKLPFSFLGVQRTGDAFFFNVETCPETKKGSLKVATAVRLIFVIYSRFNNILRRESGKQ